MKKYTQTDFDNFDVDDYQAWRKAPAFRQGDISHTLFPRKETFLVLH